VWQSPPVLQMEEDKRFRDHQAYRNAPTSKAATKISVHHCMWLSNQWSFQRYAMSPHTPCLCVASAVSQTYAPWVRCKRIIPVWRRIFTIDHVSLWSTVCCEPLANSHWWHSRKLHHSYRHSYVYGPQWAEPVHSTDDSFCAKIMGHMLRDSDTINVKTEPAITSKCLNTLWFKTGFET